MIKSGTVIGSVSGKISNGDKIKSGTVVGTANKIINEGPFVMPGMPAALQLHLTDAQKKDAAASRGFNSVADEVAYQKENPNLYAVTGGKKYSEESKRGGFAALRYPNATVTPDNLTEKGKAVIENAKNADAGRTEYDNYTQEQIDKTISAKWHRSTNDEQTKKEVNYLKALKSVKEIGFKNLYEYSKAKNSPEIIADYKSKMDAAYKEYKKSKEFIGSKIVDRYIGGAENTENIEETQKREAWENAAARYYALVYGSKQALEARYELLKTATAPMTTAWQKQAALKQLGIKAETAIREEKEIGAALKKTRTFDNYSEYIDANIKAGGINLLTGVSATGEFIVGTPIKFMIDISGGDSSIISGKAARDALAKEYGRRAMEAAEEIGDDKNVGGQLIQNIVQNIPNIALAFMTAGGSTAVTLAEKAASLSGQAGKMAKIGLAIKALAQNPLFWSSFSTTAGNDYEEAIDNGANPATATLYALMASGLNAYIEIGGGIETLPKDLVGVKNGQAMLEEFISTSLEEGGEEILQGAVSKLFSRLMYDRSHVSLESASDFAKQSLYEGAMGVLGGAVMGGGQMTFNAIMNAKTVKQYKTIGEAAISAGQADSIIKYALGSDMYSELAQSTLNTNNAQLVGEIYSYICRDIDAAINSAKSIDDAVEAIKAIARQEGINNDTYTVTKCIAMPQFIEKVNEFGIDDNTAGNVLDVILEVDKAQNDQTNAEMTEPTGADNAAGKVVEDGASGSESEENIFTEPDKKEIFEDKISGKMLTVTQQHIEETAKRLNPDIKIKWEPDLKTNGQWNPRTKVLSLNSNLSTAEAYVEIFKHEFLHSLESKVDYNAFLNYLENDSIAFAQYAKSVLTQYGIEHTGGNAGAVQALFDLYYEMYTTDTRIRPIDRQNFTMEDAKREAAADFFAGVLFKGKEYRGEIANALKYGDELPSGNAETSLSALEELAHKDKNLFVRIWDAVKRFISNLKNHATNNSVVRDLEKLERKLQDVYNSAENKNPVEDRGVKYSVSNDKKFEEYKKTIDYIESHTETSQKGKYIEVSNQTPQILVEKADAENLPMAILFDIAYLETRENGELPGNYHNIGAENMKKLPQLLENPEYIVKLENGRLNVIIRMETKKGNHALVSVELSQPKQLNGKFSKYNLIITVFGAKSGYLSGIINNPRNTVKYKKETDVQGTDRLHKSPDGINTSVSKSIIRQNSDNSQEKVSERDSEYLELAKEPESNKEKLQEMVNEAAKEAGYSERLYHQTENDFTIFDTRHAGAGTRDNETPFGIFMKKTDVDIGLKGKKQIGLFAKIENPLKAYSRDNLVRSLERLSPEYKTIKEQLANLDKEYQEKVDSAHKEWQEWISKWRNKNPNAKRIDAYNDPEFESVFSKEGEIVDKWSEQAAKLDKKAKEIITSALKSNGYDGIILLNDTGSFGRRTDAYIALESSQVKSADPVTYDDNGNAIPLSERFNESNDDIRYSLRGNSFQQLRFQPTIFAKRLINKFQLKNVDIEQLSNKLKEIVKKHDKGGSEWNYDSNGDLMKLPIVDNLINELSKQLAGHIRPKMFYEAKEVLKSIRNTTVYMDHIQRKEVISQYGSMTNFRKSTKLKESPNANVSLDSMWQEWAAAYPEWFNKDINPVDMPEEFNRIVNGLENSVEDIDEDSAAEYIAEGIRDILENTGVRAFEKESRRILEEYKLKESERLNKQNTRKRIIEAQNKLKRRLKYFERMITKPTKKNYLPSGMYEVAVNCIKGLEKTVNSDSVVYTSAYADRLLSLKEQIEYPGNLTEAEIAGLKAEFSDMYNRALDDNRFDRGADLEALGQKISLEEDKEEREKLKKRYDKIYNGDKDFGLNFNKVANSIPTAEDGQFDEFESAELKKAFNDLSERLSGKTPREYTESDWNAIDNAFAEFENTIKNYNKLIGEEKAREVSEYGQKMFGELQRTIRKPHALEWFSDMLKDPHDFFERLGNFEKNNVWLHFYDTLDNGQKDTINYVRKSIGRFNKLSADPRTKEMFDTKNLVECGIVDKKGERILVTKEFRLKLAMDSLDQDAYNHLIHSGITLPKSFEDYYKEGLLDKKTFRRQCFIENARDWQKNIFDSLSPIEREWYFAIKDYYQFSGVEIDKVFFQLNGYHLKLHEFYSHIIVDNSFLSTPFGKMYEKVLPNVMKPGFTQERVGDIKTLYGVGAVSQLVNDIESHAQYIGTAIPIHNFNKLYNYNNGFETIHHFLDEKFSGEATNYIEDMISDLIGNSRTTGNKLLRPAEKAFGKINGNYAQAVLTLNPRVSLTQTASFPMALITLDSKSLIKALLYIEDSKDKKHFGFARAERDIIDEVTALVWYRTQGYKVDDIQDVIAHKGKNVSGKLMDAVPGLFKWVNAFDEATVNRLFYATKFYVEDHFDFEKGSTEYYAKVKEIFEKTIELTQPNYTTLQRSPFMRSGSKNAIMGALSMFKTVPTMQISRLISAGEEIVTKLSQDQFTKQEKAEACKKFVKTYGAVMVSNAQLVILRMVVDALLNGFKRYRDKDEEITAKSIITGVLKDFIETPLGMLPLIGDFAASWGEKMFTGKWGFGSPTMPQLETITSLWDDAKGIHDKIADDEVGYEGKIKAVISGLEDFGTFCGYPIRNTKNIILGVYYTVDDICNRIKNDRNFFESAVKDDFVNRVFGSHVKEKSQYYRTLVDAVINGDQEKYEYTLKRFVGSTKMDADTFTGLRTAIKNTDTVKAESKNTISDVESKNVYKNLSDESKNTVESETRRIIAEEKMLSVKPERSKDFKKLYDFSRLKNKSSYNALFEELKKDGFTDEEIKIGLEIEKFKLLESEGISIAEWFTAKQALNEQNVRKNAEKYSAIQKMDFSAKEKSALWHYNK